MEKEELNSKTKKILVISPVPTHPSHAGNRKCILSYVELLKQNGYKISYLWIVSYTVKKEEYNQMNSYWGKDLYIFRKNLFHRIIESFSRRVLFAFTKRYPLNSFYPWGISQLLKRIQKQTQIDVVFVNYVYLSRIFNYFKNKVKILYTHDVFSNKFQRTGSDWFSISPNSEAYGINRADKILAIQENEAEYFRYLTKKSINTVYSYFEIVKTKFNGNKNILYIAGPNSYNVESIRWFIEEIFKKINTIVDRVQLVIGGRICNELEEYRSLDGIVFKGEVDDLEEFYSLGDIAINPTFNGTGLKIKSFEAMAYGKVLVSHKHCIEGIYNAESAPVFYDEDPRQFIKILTMLLLDQDMVRRAKEDTVKYMESFNKEVKLRFVNSINEKIK